MSGCDPAAFEAWRHKAEEDFVSAQVFSAHGGPAATICFLCHQMAEKLLKAYLVLHRRPLRRVHQLDLLLEDCLLLDRALQPLIDDVAFLKRYYIAARYPDDFPDEVTTEEAQRACAAASHIRGRILAAANAS